MRRSLVLACGIVVLFNGSAWALPGPALQTPKTQLDAVIECTAERSAKTPVLLLHGGNGTAGEYVGNYRTVLPRDGHPTCWISVPGRLLSDLQESVEYAVNAIRWMSDRFGRRIAVVGHSGGALLGSYALRYWPDLATKVQDFVGLAGIYTRGSQTFRLACSGPCPIGARQIATGSRFLTGYAGRPLYAGPSYTAISTRYDELVTPQPAAGRLDGGRTIELQSVCPGRLAEHAGLVLDAVAYQLVLDAIDHPGPASPERIVPDCGQALIPGADPVGILPDVLGFGVGLTAFASPAPEPSLRCYLDTACTKPRLRPSVVATSVAHRTRAHLRVATTGRVEQPPGSLDLCAGRVSVRLSVRGRIRAMRKVGVAADCTFRATQSLRRAPRVAHIRATVAYSGSRELLSATRRQRLTVVAPKRAS